ncbi:regulatory protein YycH of two-component signal transduction system YycFG [Planomicrobium soli]|uniref:Regulatory protein YycH of two-component signal transduction system YycFG n=1 Tax=Planomicrobium soli TaxID=1176648 RepID=A0A2P8H1D2_9BACL|nr:two-component system activity regulator YycH [Planomicrobium soli]PSL40022.1 regulatory protein YycH of two-component signal transduction system YycFG [Planomicrobium soli]
MKYVEQVKSIVLFLLILLSFALTFTIWTFTPSFDPIETTPAVDVSIGEKRTVEQVVRPIKVLYHQEDSVTGTTDRKRIDPLLATMKLWQIHDMTEKEKDASAETLQSYMHEPNRVVLYYPGTVPLPVFDAMVNITDETIPEASFDRVVIEFATVEQAQIRIYFINSVSGRVYEGSVSVSELGKFENNILEAAKEVYVTDEELGTLPIYVAEKEQEKLVYPYLLEEVTPEDFRSALFESTANVDSSGDATNEKYTDGTGAIMRFDANRKSMSFVKPRAETSDPGIPSELIFSTIDYVNDHGGWTNDYRFFGIEPLTQQVYYRLFLDNLPVFSTSTATELEMKWGMINGTEQIFRYIRPYYILQSTAQTSTKTLEAGTTALDAVSRLNEEQRKKVTEIMPAYELAQTSEKLITFEAAWYYKIDGNWLKLSKEALGGGKIGLE